MYHTNYYTIGAMNGKNELYFCPPLSCGIDSVLKQFEFFQYFCSPLRLTVVILKGHSGQVTIELVSPVSINSGWFEYQQQWN